MNTPNDTNECIQKTTVADLVQRITALEAANQRAAENVKKNETALQNIIDLMAKREEQYAARDAEVEELRRIAKKVHALPIVAVSIGGLALAAAVLALVFALR